MTSRRSRLKAVANLPVRRKLPAPHDTANETTAYENLTLEKGILASPKTEAPLNSTCQNYEAEKNILIEDVQIGKNGIQQTLLINCVGDFPNPEHSTLTKVIDETSEFSNVNVLENNNDLNRNCNLNDGEVEFSNSSLFKGDKCFNSNAISSLVHESQAPQESDIFEENQSLEKLSVDDIISSGVVNNKDNNIVDDGIKCYTVLSPHNIALTSVSNYTITTLTPCINTCSTTSENDIFAEPINHEFSEIQIYTEIVEPTEICISNEINDNCKSAIDSESLTTDMIDCNIQKQVHEINVNLEYNRSSLSESTNLSQNTFVKPSVKAGGISAKLSVSGDEESFRNAVTTIRDKPGLGNSVTSISQNVPPDYNSSTKSISSIRRKRSKCNDFTKKLADARREFQKKYEKTKPDRSTLKMIDLIFYNPSTNPMESKTKYEKKELSGTQGEHIQEILAEEKVDEPDSVDCESELQINDNTESDISNMPVPQVKIGLNGEIILDEKSLIIETTDARKGRKDLQNSIPIFEDRGSKVSYYRTKTKKTRDWADFETKRFYKALNTIGPDFSLMQKYFPKRSRLDLKNKFKREERLNRNLIDRALNNPSEFDMTQLEQDLAVEKKAEQEEVEMRLYRGVKQASKRPRTRSSFLSREMIESDGESENTHSKIENANSKKLNENEKNKKKKENSLILQKFLMREAEKEMNDSSEMSSSSINIFSQADHDVT